MKGPECCENLVNSLPEFCRLKETLVPVKGCVLKILSVANTDELVDRAQSVEELPFWAELWPSALALAKHFGVLDLQGLSILELGAGVGLAGLAASLAGAQVVQSDFIPLALEFCRINALRNNASGIRFLQADWRSFPPSGPFDVICGSDILYEPFLHSDLQQIFSQALKPGGRVILADPFRPHADAFARRMSKAGWEENLAFVTCHPVTGNQEITIAVYEYTRRDSEHRPEQ